MSLARAGNPGRGAGLIVVDPLALVREGVRALAAPLLGLVVVGDAATGAEALRLAARRRPELVLVAARLPDLTGAELTRRLRARHPGVGAVLLAGVADASVVADALAAGARGALAREAGADVLTAALRALARGEVVVDPRLAHGEPAPAPAPAAGPLSPREREVLELLAEGLSNRAISEHLTLSAETVKTHVGSILAKLGAEGRTHAVALAIRRAIID